MPNRSPLGAGSVRNALLLCFCGVVVALLTVTSLQLHDVKQELRSIRLADEPGLLPATSAPQLPSARGSGTGSARTLLDQLDRTTRDFRAPLDTVAARLGGLDDATGSLNQVPTLLRQMVRQVAVLQQVAPALQSLAQTGRELAPLRRALAQLAPAGRALPGIEATLRRVSSALTRILATTRALAASTSGVNARLGEGVQALNRTNELLAGMSGDLKRAAACLQRPVICDRVK